MDPSRTGSLSPALESRVNGEIYRFADARDLRLFRRAPARYCGLLRDPVTGLRFYPGPRSPRCEWDGGPYLFSSDSTRTAFLRAPQRYQVRRPG